MSDQKFIVVDVPGVGDVEFPATMSMTEITREAARLHNEAALTDPNRKPTSAEDYLPQKPQSDGKLRNFARALLPSTTPRDYIEGPIRAVTHPIDSLGLVLGALLDAHRTQFQKAGANARGVINEPTLRGKAESASRLIGHTAAGLLPVVGPAAANIGEQGAEGDFDAMIGGGAGLITGVLAPKVVAKVAPRVPGIGRTTNPQLAEAVAFGEREGIPIDPATASGRPILRRIQKRVGDTLGGSGNTERFQTSQQQALTATGRQLAERADPTAAASPETAGRAIRDDVQGVIRREHATANTSYERLRQIEHDPANRRSVQVGKDGDGKPIMEDMAAPVDVRSAKAALKPILERLQRLYPIAQRQASKGYQAIENIVNGKDYVPLTEADDNLSAIKSVSRGADMPELRSTSQGLAAQAVAELESAVQRTTATLGAEATTARNTGRAATTAKYAAEDVLSALREEPVQVFNQATYARDAGIQQLREMAKLSPDGLRKVGRAYLDDLVDKATKDGKFDHAQALAASWEKLGPETKKLLFKDPAYIRDLDNFFRLAKTVSENPNPSGTAGQLTATNVASALPMKLASKMLYSRRGIQLLINGIRLPSGRVAMRASAMPPKPGMSAGRGVAPSMADKKRPDDEETRKR
jgi:hypothetical protein